MALLAYLMDQHGLSQSQVPEVGAQSVVSAILAGRRRINGRMALALAQRFRLPAEAFLSDS
jgi:HTH-type transcriptional regulator/antitoxin HigA